MLSFAEQNRHLVKPRSCIEREALRFIACLDRERAVLTTAPSKDPNNTNHRHPCTQIPVYARRGDTAQVQEALDTAGLDNAWPQRCSTAHGRVELTWTPYPHTKQFPSVPTYIPLPCTFRVHLWCVENCGDRALLFVLHLGECVRGQGKGSGLLL